VTRLPRRAFLGSASVATTALLARSTPAAEADPVRSPPPCAPSGIGPWVGRPLTQLRDEYRRELFDVVLPFWDRHGIDHERGGFMCALDHDGTPVNTHKFLWFQGRGIWVYSFLFNRFGRDPRHLEVARKTVRFCLEHVRQAGGRWAQLVSREGTLLEPPRPDASGVLYLAEGLQEYAVAAGDDEARVLALRLVKDTFLEADRPPSEGGVATRRQGLWFATLLVATQMLARRADAELEGIAGRCMEALLARHHNPGTGLNDEVVSFDPRAASPEPGFTVFGHSIEALWMAMDDALRRKDGATVTTCAERIHRHLEVGWDRVHGGLCHAVKVGAGDYVWPVERPVGTNLAFQFAGEYHYMKSFWSLCETLVATLKVLEHAPAEWAARYLRLAQDAIHTRFSLKAQGHPLYTLFADRRITPSLHATRQENYHHPRALMLGILALDRLIAAGAAEGRTS
jgi:N-acylglucosamine 2-epimerase